MKQPETFFLIAFLLQPLINDAFWKLYNKDYTLKGVASASLPLSNTSTTERSSYTNVSRNKEGTPIWMYYIKLFVDRCCNCYIEFMNSWDDHQADSQPKIGKCLRAVQSKRLLGPFSVHYWRGKFYPGILLKALQLLCTVIKPEMQDCWLISFLKVLSFLFYFSVSLHRVFLL